jgi:hypothetical protein
MTEHARVPRDDLPSSVAMSVRGCVPITTTYVALQRARRTVDECADTGKCIGAKQLFRLHWLQKPLQRVKRAGERSARSSEPRHK